jgi:hypothetical protein
MLDRILEVGRNADGLFYNEVDPRSGKVLAPGIADNFGYTFNAYWHIGAIDSKPAYQAAVRQGLASLSLNYTDHNWENGSADGDADAVEGALNRNRPTNPVLFMINLMRNFASKLYLCRSGFDCAQRCSIMFVVGRTAV